MQNGICQTVNKHKGGTNTIQDIDSCRVNHVVENNEGSKLSLQMTYSPLTPVNLDAEEVINVLHRKLADKISEGSRVIILQKAKFGYRYLAV